MKTKMAYASGVLVITIMTMAMKSSIETKVFEPEYASQKSKEVIKKMIEAHGGLEVWQSKPSISYRHSYVGPWDPSDPWTSDEIVEQGSRRVYQNWPLDTSQVIYDGMGYYGVNWTRGNPPKFTAHLAMYFSNIPWLTQDEGVNLGEVRKRKMLDDPKEYFAVKMTFENSVGESSDDYYDLFIDPDTYLLRGFEYIMTYGALLDQMELPSDVKFMGPFIKKIEGYDTIENLKLPNKLITIDLEGKDYGTHYYNNWSFSKPFSDDLVKLPSNAVKDNSSSKRKM